MKKFVLSFFLSFFTTSAFAAHNTYLCEMVTQDGSNSVSLEFTYYDHKLANLVEESANNNSPFTVKVKVSDFSEEDLSLQAKPFGFEPGMFRTQDAPVGETGFSFQIVYDMWAMPTLVIALKQGNTIYIRKACELISESK